MMLKNNEPRLNTLNYAGFQTVLTQIMKDSKEVIFQNMQSL